MQILLSREKGCVEKPMAQDNCPICGREMSQRTIKIKHGQLNIDTEGWVCTKAECGYWVLNKDQVQKLIGKLLKS